MALYLRPIIHGNNPGDADNSVLTPGLDFYNEYIWSSRGGTQEVKHTYSTSYEEVHTMTTATNTIVHVHELQRQAQRRRNTMVLGQGGTYDHQWTHIKQMDDHLFGIVQFDITASFDGIETDTQMRYACNNDAHFVMNFNSMFNPNNQSGLNLVIGSDGLVYNIVPSVTSGAGLPMSDNIDTSFTYTAAAAGLQHRQRRRADRRSGAL